MRLVDFHCHLDLYPDPVAAVSEADEARIYTLTMTTTPRAWPRNRELTERTACVRAALGLHPQLIADHSKELALWERYLPEARYIGEVGLDAGPRYFRSLDLQKQVFERILRLCSDAGGKIISAHSVRATKVVLDLIEANLPPARGKVVLHWFTGPVSEIRRAVDLGCYFSINAAMFSSERGCSAIDAIPVERILTETDGPFTSTEGRPAKPTDIGILLGKLATVHATTPHDMAKRIVANLRTLVGAAEESLAAETLP
jgi:TatD DNase family protein